MTPEAIEERLYDLAIAYWDLQAGNYDIEWNYKELLDFDFEGPGLDEKLDQVAARCKQIRLCEKPPHSPDADSIFRDRIAPVPNNSIINAVVRAIMAGGADYLNKSPGWQVQAGDFFYEVKHEKAGTITVTIAACDDPAGFVRSLSLFTLDVLIGIVAHLCGAYCAGRPGNTLSLKTSVTAMQLLRDRQVKSYGEKRWAMVTKINEEMEKLGRFRISVEDSKTQDGNHSYQSRLAVITTVKRDFDPHRKRYVPSCWSVQPGNWATYNMSKRQYEFLGKLDQTVLKYDHREQRASQAFAKKLMYALFVIPGGTYYVYNGAKKTLREYLELIGEYRAEDPSGNSRRRTLQRLADALDFLVDQAMITTSIAGRVADFIKKRRGPWQTQKLLDTTVEIKMAGPP